MSHFYESFHPNNYNIYLDINRATKTITGKTIIRGEALASSISIHQKYLDIKSVLVDNQAAIFKMRDEAILLPDVKTGDIEVIIEYSAKLTDSMMGIYPSYYEVDGEKKQLIGTQFETTFARQAFPSVDEPSAKATFDLAIKFDEHPGETIIANMPEIRVEDGVHYFETTVKMSTYLVAFAFGEMLSKYTTTESGVKIGVFATKAHQAKELDFGLDIAKRSIEFYEDFYQTPYPLPHSWQLALPDFSAGAMENWGLVTYREAYLLIDPDNTSLSTKQLVSTVISHELAHQWFGDLVTMKWWDDLWLNESFANMMEYVAIDALEPDWKIWESFQTSEAPAALQRDAIDGVQSVHVQVEDPAEIDSLFDGAIVYAKGARMLVMVRALIGDDALRKGLKNYFASHQFGNATGADLWAALGETSGMDIGRIMQSWLEQPGYPVVNAKVVDGKLTISQSQFFIGENEPKARQWQIPLNSNYAEAPAIFADTETTLGNYQQLRSQNGAPFRLNVGNNSHFIVKYDEKLLADIIEHVDELDSISQLQLLQDLRLLAEGGQISYATVVPLLGHFITSPSNIVNSALYSLANDLKKFVTPNSVAEQQLQAFFNKMSDNQVNRLGWLPVDGETNDDQLTRPYVLNATLYAENQKSIEMAHQIYQNNADKVADLPADVRVFILKNEIKNYGNRDLVNQMLTAYRQTADASYKSDLRVAVTSTQDADLIKQIVTEFKNAETIKPQDLRAWFRGILANSHGEQAAWDWIRNDWDWLEKTVGGDMEFTTYITVIAGIFKTPTRLKEFKYFFWPMLETPGLKREITMDLKVIESRVNLIAAEQVAVNQAVEAQIK